MSTVETYLGGAQLPIGAIQFMAPNFAGNTFNNRGQEWLRTGVLTQYDAAKHAAAVAAGLGVTQRGISSTLMGQTAQGPDKIHFVNGQAGYLVTAPSAQAEQSNASYPGLMFVPFGAGLEPAMLIDASLPPGYTILSEAHITYVQTFGGWATYSWDTTLDALTVWICKDNGAWRSVGTFALPGPNTGATSCTFFRASNDIVLFQYASATASNYTLGAFQFDAAGNVVARAYAGAGTNPIYYACGSPEGWIFYYLDTTTTTYQTYAGFLATFVSGTIALNNTTLSTTAFPVTLYANGRWVMLGLTGTNTVHSGTTFQTITSRTVNPGTATWAALGYTNGYYIVSGTGTSNTAAISTDGVTWNSVTSAAQWSDAILYNDIAVNSVGYIELSTRVVTTRGNAFQSIGTIAAGGSSIVHLGYDQIFTSVDNAKTWSSTYFGGATTNAATFVKYTGGRFFARMNTDLLQSADGGLTWSIVTHPLTGAVADVEWFNGKWYIGAASGTSLNYAYSTNLSAWTTGAIRTTASNVLGFLSIGSTLHAFTSTGGASSTDGINWTSSTGGLTANFRYDASWYDGTTAVAFTWSAGTYTRYVSTDAGATWTAATGSGIGSNFTATSNLIKFNNFYWTTARISNGYCAVLRSADALTWTGRPTFFPLYTGTTTPNKLAVLGQELLGVFGFAATAPATSNTPTCVIDSTGSAAFVGVAEPIVLGDAAGFVRVS